MAPKQSKPLTTGYSHSSSSEENQNFVNMMMAQISLESFVADVAASSSDDLKTLLPSLIAKQEEFEKKCKNVSSEIKQREKEAIRALAKSKASQKKEEKKSRMHCSVNLL